MLSSAFSRATQFWSTHVAPISKCAICFVLCSAVILFIAFNDGSQVPLLQDTQWRERVDPQDSLTNHQRSTIFASLKPIFDKSADEDKGVSTLLILATDEAIAGKVARCLLDRVNTATEHRGVSYDR